MCASGPILADAGTKVAAKSAASLRQSGEASTKGAVHVRTTPSGSSQSDATRACPSRTLVARMSFLSRRDSRQLAAQCTSPASTASASSDKSCGLLTGRRRRASARAAWSCPWSSAISASRLSYSSTSCRSFRASETNVAAPLLERNSAIYAAGSCGWSRKARSIPSDRTGATCSLR
eukprot:scaffold10028_cov236-Isochrysis_galbana.AAC.1